MKVCGDLTGEDGTKWWPLSSNETARSGAKRLMVERDALVESVDDSEALCVLALEGSPACCFTCEFDDLARVESFSVRRALLTVVISMKDVWVSDAPRFRHMFVR